jgi:hypothetical protein
LEQVSQPVNAIQVPVAYGRHSDYLPIKQFNPLLFRQYAGGGQGKVLGHSETPPGVHIPTFILSHNAGSDHCVFLGVGKMAKRSLVRRGHGIFQDDD